VVVGWRVTVGGWRRARMLDALIPTRFLTTLAHLLAVIMLFSSKDSNIKVALPLKYDEASFDELDTELTIGLWFALACLAIELVGLFGGYTIFRPGMTLYHIVSHFVGCVMLTFFITESWHYSTFWYIFVISSAPPALAELSVIVGSALRGDSY